ncbi:MAG: queuosine precursor transporter [Parachlamydiales bacterium]|nr:queuosine precursor transporter [Parachlamydiales bacterium]
MLLTNLVGLKLFKLGPFFMPASMICYPLTFVISDAVADVFGAKKAGAMVRMGFVVSLISYIFIQLAIALPADSHWFVINNPYGFLTHKDYQKAMEATFSLNGIIVAASMLAYLVAQMLDVYLFQMIKQRTKGRHLWLRNNLSTIVAQGVDTLIIATIVFWFGMHMSLKDAIRGMATVWTIKVILALISTPLTYLTVYFLNAKHKQYQTKLRPAPQEIE